MSILNLSNYRSNRYNPHYLKLLPVASRERPPQAKEFEDVQDIIINPINNYTKNNFNEYEILSGLKVLSITSNSVTLSQARILINNYPVIIQTEQETITNTSTNYIVYIAINITELDNKYTYNYTLNTTSGYPLIQCNNGTFKFLTKSLTKDFIRSTLYEVYGNFIKWGLVYTNNCVTPGEAYIKGNKISFPYHTSITTNLTEYRLVILNKEIQVWPPSIKLDKNNTIDLGLYKDNKWHSNLYNLQIKNKDINILQDNLNKLRDYLLETALLKPIDTTSNLITDTFNNTDNADTTNLLFDCDIEQGNLILNKFSRITNDISINNVGTNTKIVNNTPSFIIQDFNKTPLISQLQSDSFITTNSSTRGILKLGPYKLDTSIYKRTSDKTILLTQTIINAEAYGLTPNQSDFSLTIGPTLISTIITTDANGKALFSFSLPFNPSINDVITVQNSTSSATSSLIENTYSLDNTYVGQVINIEEDNTTISGGQIYIRRVTSANPTIKVLLVKWSNNQPQEVIDQTVIENINITTSPDASNPTEFIFDFPITLSKGQYALIITSVNNSIDLFISNNSTLTNSNLFSYDINQTTITPFLNKDLKFELYKPIYKATTAPTTITVRDNIDKFDYIYYPGKFRIGPIEYTNEAEVSPTNELDIVVDVNKFSIVSPILISTNKTESTYISRTIRTNFKYTNVFLELDVVIPDSTEVIPYISSNEGYTWERLTGPTNFLIDGNDQTFRYIYNVNLTPLTYIINQLGNTTEATRNYLTIRIDLSTESDNKPIVKGYKCFVN